jgi:TPR repeat protein
MIKKYLTFIAIFIFSFTVLAETSPRSCKDYFSNHSTLEKNSGQYFFNIAIRQLPDVKNKKEFNSLVNLLIKSADNGYFPSYYALGMLYEQKFKYGSDWVHSRGEMTDLQNSIKYLEKAASFTSVAEYALGDIYLAYANITDKNMSLNDSSQIKGIENILPDIDKAIYWLTLAAKHGNPQAQGTLSDLYFQGIGLPQDFVMAYVWQNISTASQIRFNKQFQNGEIGKRFAQGCIKDTKKQYNNLTAMQKNEAQIILKKYSSLYFSPPKEIDTACSNIQTSISCTFAIQAIQKLLTLEKAYS